MFTQKDINLIDKKYFAVLSATSFAITLRSKCTGHEWHLIARDNRNWSSCEVYHRHKSSDPWHVQWPAKALATSIASIQSHDQYQLSKDNARANRICKKKLQHCNV